LTVLFDQLSNHPEDYFSPGQWVMGDSAFKQTDYFVSPYKRSRGVGLLPRAKKRFNKHFSRMRVTIEHAFGMLKMRFQSLKSLRSQIDTEIDLHRSLNWIRSCVILHNFLGNQRVDDFWDDLSLPHLYGVFERMAAENREAFAGFDGGGEDGGGGSDRKRRFIHMYAENRNYQPVHAAEDSD
jgi:hypothetical protein